MPSTQIFRASTLCAFCLAFCSRVFFPSKFIWNFNFFWVCFSYHSWEQTSLKSEFGSYGSSFIKFCAFCFSCRSWEQALFLFFVLNFIKRVWSHFLIISFLQLLLLEFWCVNRIVIVRYTVHFASHRTNYWLTEVN